MAWILWTMVYLFNALDHSRPGPMPPERRRAVVIGACPAGISAAYHLGEHSLLLDQRDTLEDSHDRSNDFPMGTARGGAVGAESPAAEGQRPGVSPAERKALFISCSSSKLIHIERWRPPDHGTQPRGDEHSGPSSAMALIPLLRGEIRLGSCVVRISPSAHMLDLADGHRIIYDKLLSAIPLATLARLVMHEVPGRVRCDEILRYWLGEHDVELADSATQDYFGDLDDFAAGRRVATLIEHALDLKFGRSPGRHGGGKLFEPRIVTAAPAMP